MSTTIQQRRDAAADWTSNNPTLAEGEVGWESDTGKRKTGDGSTVWTSLPYDDPSDRYFVYANPFTTISGSPAAGVTNGSRLPYVSFPNGSTAAITVPVPQFPLGWNTADAFLWVVTLDATASGNVVANSNLRALQHGDDASDAGDYEEESTIGDGAAGFAVTGGAAWTVTRIAGDTGIDVTVGHDARLRALNFQRVGGGGNDTFGGALGFVAMELVRAS